MTKAGTASAGKAARRNDASDGVSVSHYMSGSPCTIGRGQSLTSAHELMRKHHVRHLPVLDAGRLAGVLSERDLALVEAMPHVNPTDVRVEEAMTTEVYEVAPEDPLVTVAVDMSDRKLGSAVVMDKGRVVGVFTTVDALRALADALRGR